MVGLRGLEGIRWAADILNGRREFPTYNKTTEEGDGFKEIFEKELSRMGEKPDTEGKQCK